MEWGVVNNQTSGVLGDVVRSMVKVAFDGQSFDQDSTECVTLSNGHGIECQLYILRCHWV